MTGNYPAGAAEDPNAPFNRKDPIFKKCPECNGEGGNVHADGLSAEACHTCAGEGEIEVDPQEEDYEEW